MSGPLRISSLGSSHRSRVEAIVRATGVFSDEEIDVALEVFDESMAESGKRKAESGRRKAEMDAESGIERPPQPISDFRSPISDFRSPISDYELLGAFTGDDLLGYACFGPAPSTDRTFDLYWIAVHPEAQGSGTGAALMDAVERRLADYRARMLVIETSSRDDYAPTRRFYRKRGYQEAARLRDFYAPGDDRLILARRVDAPPSPEAPDRSPTFPLLTYE